MQVASSRVPVSYLADFVVSVQSTSADVCAIFRASCNNQPDREDFDHFLATTAGEVIL